MRITSFAIPAVAALTVLGAPTLSTSEETHPSIQLAARDRWWSPLFSCFKKQKEDCDSESSMETSDPPFELEASDSDFGTPRPNSQSSTTLNGNRRPSIERPQVPKQEVEPVEATSYGVAEDLQKEWEAEFDKWTYGDKVVESPRYDVNPIFFADEADEENGGVDLSATQEDVERFGEFLDFMLAKAQALTLKQKRGGMSSEEKNVLRNGTPQPGQLIAGETLYDGIMGELSRGVDLYNSISATGSIPQGAKLEMIRIQNSVDLHFFIIRKGLAGIKSPLLLALNLAPTTSAQLQKQPSRWKFWSSRT